MVSGAGPLPADSEEQEKGLKVIKAEGKGLKVIKVINGSLK